MQLPARHRRKHAGPGSQGEVALLNAAKAALRKGIAQQVVDIPTLKLELLPPG